MKSLEEVLNELDGIVRKYQGLARRKRRTWNQLRLATEDLDGIRSKLTFHVTAINAFTSSLSRGSLAQIETILLHELVGEVRQGRRHSSLASLHETDNDNSVWRELESELARDGISGAEVAKHKLSIKVFVQGLLSNSNVDTASLAEVASLMEFGKDDTDSESLSHSPFAMDPLTTANAQNGCLVSMDDKEDESADEEHEGADDDFTTPYAGASNAAIQPGLRYLNDALTYLDQVQAMFVHQPAKYDQFLCVLKSFKMNVLDTSDVIEWVCALFVCYPELIRNFTTFLPHGWGIECGVVDNHQAFRVVMPFAAYVRIPDLEATQPLTMEGEDLHTGLLKWIDPASLNILQRCSVIAADWTIEQSASQASGAIQARMTFPARLKAFLARSMATKDYTANTGRSEEANDIIHVSDRTGLMRILRRPPQPPAIKLS